MQLQTVLVLIFPCIASLSGQSFKPNAKDFLEVQLRGRDSGPDITEVEVYATLGEMVEGEVGIESLTLELLEEGGCWGKAEGRPIKRGRRYRWRVTITPCIKYAFRLVLASSNSSCVEYLEHPKLLGGSPLWMVEQSDRFSPTKPKDLKLRTNSTLQWFPVPCASHYEVTYTDGSDTRVILEDSPSSKLNLPSECQEIQASVKAVSGDQKSTKASITFNTCPDDEEEESKDITLDVSSFLLSEDEEKVCPKMMPVCGDPSPSELSRKSLPSTGGPYTEEIVSPSSAPIIAGSVVLALVFICLVIGGVILLRKRMARRNSAEIEKI